jgi:signal peptidase I
MSLRGSSQNNKSEYMATHSEVLMFKSQDVFEDILNREITLRVKVTGKSMAPFLKGGETLNIRKVCASSLRIGDLIFFKNNEGSAILHRIVKKRPTCQNSYIFQTKGDALRGMDSPVDADDIIGKVCSVEKIYADGKNRYLDMESVKWKSISYMLAVFGLGRSAIFSAGYRIRYAIRHIYCKALF